MQVSGAKVWTPVPVSYLEMDIAHACNLSCKACTHYSNYGLRGAVPFARGSQWLMSWAARLAPASFALVGGEPTLNDELCDYIRLACELWPGAERIVITNGLSIGRHPGLFELLAETDTRLDLSMHSYKDTDYLLRFNRSLVEIETARARFGFRMAFRPGEYRFYRTYRGEGPEMRPFFDNDPESSYKVCANANCRTIHLGALWKCPPLAYLGLAADKLGLGEVEEWRAYLAYKPLSPDAGQDELVDFLGRGAEACCGMCPAKLEYFEQERVVRVA